jgi:hypothetical protein
MKKSTILIFQLLSGISLGSAVAGAIFWNFGPTSDQPPAVKIGIMIFLAIVTFWFGMTHRTPDKERLDFKSM